MGKGSCWTMKTHMSVHQLHCTIRRIAGAASWAKATLSRPATIVAVSGPEMRIFLTCSPWYLGKQHFGHGCPDVVRDLCVFLQDSARDSVLGGRLRPETPSPPHEAIPWHTKAQASQDGSSPHSEQASLSHSSQPQHHEQVLQQQPQQAQQQLQHQLGRMHQQREMHLGHGSQQLLQQSQQQHTLQQPPQQQQQQQHLHHTQQLQQLQHHTQPTQQQSQQQPQQLQQPQRQSLTHPLLQTINSYPQQQQPPHSAYHPSQTHSSTSPTASQNHPTSSHSFPTSLYSQHAYGQPMPQPSYSRPTRSVGQATQAEPSYGQQAVSMVWKQLAQDGGQSGSQLVSQPLLSQPMMSQPMMSQPLMSLQHPGQQQQQQHSSALVTVPTNTNLQAPVDAGARRLATAGYHGTLAQMGEPDCPHLMTYTDCMPTADQTFIS